MYVFYDLGTVLESVKIVFMYGYLLTLLPLIGRKCTRIFNKYILTKIKLNL